MKRYIFLTLMACAAAGCTEKISTAPDLGFLRVNPRTAEVVIPFDDFVDEVLVFGGYGSTAEIDHALVAVDYGGLNARTLVLLDFYPTRSDQVPGLLTFSDGRIVIFFDTLRGIVDSPVDIEVFQVVEEWHPASMTWDFAVDTAGEQRAWSQPGGDLTTLLGGATFRPAQGDSVSIPIDSATVVALGELIDERTSGLLVTGAEPGVFLQVVDVVLMLTSSTVQDPDTVFEEPISVFNLGFMVDPAPAAPLGWLRVGGTPSWRTVFTMSIPRLVTGTPEICGSVGCQVDLTEVEVNLAELVLTARQTQLAWQPQDTTRVDIRPVLNPELLPKSPLGERVAAVPKGIPPELFSVQPGTEVLLSLTSLVAQIFDTAAETGTVPVTSIALFTAPEPGLIGSASFEGPGGPGAPALRLLYTVANPVGLP